MKSLITKSAVLIILILALKHGSTFAEDVGKVEGVHTNNTNENTKWSWAKPKQELHYCARTDWPYFSCKNRTICFSLQQSCDGHDDCGGSEASGDECQSMCLETFRCQSTNTCIAMDKFCDGVVDCDDESDEMPAGNNDTDEGFACANGWRAVLKTDNGRHWKENRVSKNFEARKAFNQKYIQNKCRLPSSLVCDGINHCGDHSDECLDECGSDTKFFCEDGTCISKVNVCDGHKDCSDGSDECIYNCSQTFSCSDGTCIPFQLFCDGVVDCPDGSDEYLEHPSTYNSRSQFSSESVLCSNIKNLSKQKCLLPFKYNCDGHEQCLNREDECKQSCSYSFLCKNGKCIVDTKECDGIDDCGDMSDECYSECNLKFECDDGKCISLDRFCNGHKDCADAEDEDDIVSDDGFYCSSSSSKKLNNQTTERECRLPRRYICDGINHCENRKDECDPDCRHSFFCGRENTCVPRTGLCDGVAECDDYTDEPKLNKPLIYQKGFKCMVSRKGGISECILPQRFVNESFQTSADDCIDGGNLCKPANGGFNSDNSQTCLRCLADTNVTISKKQLCDGVFDCPDLSDECLCENTNLPQICQHICFEEEDPVKCPCKLREIPCLLKSNKQLKVKVLEDILKQKNVTEMVQCIDSSLFCDGIDNCDNSADELYCSSDSENQIQKHCSLNTYESENPKFCNKTFEDQSANRNTTVSSYSWTMKCFRYKQDNRWTPEYAIACDGNPECFYMEDECDVGCNPLPEFCSHRTQDGSFNCNGARILPGGLVCNGLRECKGDYDEQDCPGRFSCWSGIMKSVKLSKRCNWVEDCKDGSDERNCSSNTHFYCETSNEKTFFVRRSQVLDGNEDCEDGSDECPSEHFSKSLFSSIEFMIKQPFLQVMVWIMGIFAVVGNVAVVIHSIEVLGQSGNRKLTNVAMVYNCLVLNLSIADFFMGIFLVTLGVNNAATSGKYCKIDRSWRTGKLCQALGVMATLSAEVSLVTLAILSSYRMYCVRKPIKSRALRVSTAVLYIFFTWIFGLVLALFPLHPSIMDYFVSQVWMPANPYFFNDVIQKEQFTSFCERIATYISLENPNNLTLDRYCSTWKNIMNSIKQLDPSYKFEGKFGYYSAHATCLPKMFLTQNEAAWEYSLAITIFNFLVCVYIVFTYSFIWRPRQINKTVINSQSTKNMQKKIAVLIVTDCACWMPICLIAFLRFSGVDISNGMYAFTAIVLLPINSALNPILYSNTIQHLFSNAKSFLERVEAVNSVREEIGNISLIKCSRKKPNEVEEDDDKLLKDQYSHICSTRPNTEHTTVESLCIAESII